MSTTDLPPVTLLQQEVQSITSSMRRNQRWASTSAQQFAASQPPLPPYLQANKKRRAGGGAGLIPAPKPRRSKGGDAEEGDLMGGFIDLRRMLGECRDITQITPLEAVSPFLALIRSPLTSGPITSLSLTSLHAIILNILPLHLSPPPRHVAPSTPLQVGLAHITSTLSSCRFPSSSPQQDELVLLRLLRVIEALAIPLVYPQSSYIGSMLDHMGDESVCELLEVGLGMLARARLSEGLRSTAQSCVQTIVRAAFKRLKTLTPDDVEKLLQAAKEAEVDREKREAVAQTPAQSPKQEKIALDSTGRNSAEDEAGKEEAGSRESQEGQVSKAVDRASIDTKASASGSTIEQDVTPPPFTPYGLPTILELLRVLIALLNPSDQAHTDSMRYAALAVLNTALEVGGNALGTWPELREGVRDEGCKYLFQLTRSDSSPLLAQSLRTTSTLFNTMLPHLKLQLELFLSYLIDRLTPPPSASIPVHLQNLGSRPGTPVPNGVDPEGLAGGVAGTLAVPSEAATPTASTPKPMANLPPVPNETRELMLETLTQLAQRPGFMVDCWVNFDCSTDSEDIFDRLIAFLSRGVYPVGPPKQDGSTQLFEGLEGSQLSSLEVLLSYIGAMSDRLEEGADTWPSSAPAADSFASRKERKGVLIQGASMFNAKPKNGLAFLEKEGIITYDASPEGLEGEEKDKAEKGRAEAVARFLRSSSRLDKKEIGDYISRPDQVPLLTAFMRTFDFRGKSIADAMRELLETFRLPGEAQPIARITEVFAEVFFASGPPEIASQDAVYVLAYSVIMLNTDLHNPQNRKRMTIDDYKRNLRGVNDGKDFDPEYLAGIHESLKKKEIILPEEHSGQAGFEYAWKSLMQRTRTAGPMISCNTSLFDEAMFKRSWRPLIASIAYAFTMSAQDEHVIQKAITGFRQCATLAGRFGLPEVFDTIVLSLSNATGLLDNMSDSDPATANFPVIDKDNQSLTISPLSIQFGQSYRSQLATVVLFAIAKSHAGAVRQGWLQIFEMFQTLFLHGLLPMPMLQMEDFLAGQTTIPMKTAAPAVRGDAAAGGGLLSTLSSYLLSPYGASAENVAQMEVEDEDVESSLVAVDCLASCKLEELYGEVLNLPPAALVPALSAIRQLAETRSTTRLAQRKGALERSETGSPRRMNFEGQLPYDPACVFHLEMMVSLASRQKESIAETWPIIFEYIASLLNSAQHYSVLLTERAVVGLLRLCLIVSETPALRDQLYIALDILRSLPSSVLANVSEQLMAGIAKILEKDSSVVRSQTEWGLIIALFRATANHPEASKVTLAIVQKMVNEQSGPDITVDNWKGVVDLLDEFGTAAGWANAANGVRRPGGMPQQQKRNSGSQKQQQLAPVVERGLAALESLYELQHFVPLLAKELPQAEIWHALWFPVLSILSKHTVNPVREIRQRAISYLQRVLLSPSLLGADQATLPLVFDKILFPIMDEVLKPASMERDPGGFGETRTKAATAMCKVFLQYHVNLAPEQVGVLFGRLLDRMERFMKGERDMLNEAGESLKNLILVMHSSGLLVPPPSTGKAEDDQRTDGQNKLWADSEVKIERVLPGFLGENVVPPAPPVRKSVEATQGAEAAK